MQTRQISMSLTHLIAVGAALIICALFTTFTAHAASTGGFIDRSPGSGATFVDVDFINDELGVAVGTSGAIYQTADGGASWTAKPSGTSVTLNDVEFSTNGVVYAVGNNGVILKSTDYGSSWAQQVSESTGNFTSVSTANASLVWAVGDTGRLYSTSNGTTWSQIGSPDPVQINAIDFPSTTLGFAVSSDGTMFRTTDGGVNWVTTGNLTGGSALWDVNFSDTSIGYASGSNKKIYRTTNGGQSWQQLTVPASIANDFMFLKIEPQSNRPYVAAIGANGKFILSEDNGDTWNVYDEPSNVIMYGLKFLAANLYVAVGANGSIAVFDGRAPSAPGNLVKNPTATVSKNAAPTFSWSASSDVGSWIAAYKVKMDGGVLIDNETMLVYSSPNLSDGSHTFSVYAIDRAGNESEVSTLNFTVDTVGPTVSAVTPTTGKTGAIITARVTPSDANGVAFCLMYTNGGNINSMQPAGGDFTVVKIFNTAGTYALQARCTDNAGNETIGPTTNIVITTGTTDTVAPVVSSVGSFSTSVGSQVTFSASATDNVGITVCNLYVDGVNKGVMTLSGNVAMKVYSFSTAGSYNVHARCSDGTFETSGSNSTITVSGTSTPVTSITPSAANSFISVSPTTVAPNNSSVSTLTVIVRNSNNTSLSGKIVSLSSSRPSVDAVIALAATTNDLGQATFTVRSTSAGVSSYTAVVDGMVIGTASVNFSEGSSPVLGGNPLAGALIKLQCPPNASLNDVCRAVYFVGPSGKRHAFPGSKVYFTWYSDFNNVTIVSPSYLASLPLGKNIGYRPGTRMVKFVSDNSVYVVAKGNVLRRMPNETIAKALYGTLWNKQIDDISDAFFGDYVFGLDVQTSGSYSPDAERAGVPTPLQNF